MRFTDFLQEQKEKHAVMAFGRMNPISSGHEKLVNKVKEIADKVGGTPHIIVSHSQDAKKNPLTPAQKLKHAKRAFPGVKVSTSDSSAPNFLAQAAKLHKSGVTHFHMVGGSDRVDEYHKILHKYNGVKGAHGHFNFKHIKVHSAGSRDPDAEGVEGMSASKLRAHAESGNFKEFRKGVPSAMTDEHAKDMYNDVRKGMKLKEDIDEDFKDFLIEGVHDQSIFKAVFLAGGPGSGKDYVLDNTLSGHGLTEINSDKALEFLMDKEGLDKKMPSNQKEARDFVRSRAKNITELKQRLALMGRNGLIINGTGDDPEKIKRIKKGLEELGYDTSMLMVNTANEVSASRNIERGQRGGRTVPEDIRRQKWEAVQNARPELAKLFGDRYVEFDNSEDLRTAPPEVVKSKKDEMLELYKNVKQFVSEPPKSKAAQAWVAQEMEKADTLPVPKQGAEMPPHSDSQAAEEARRLGLQYYGFGRYGRNGKVTHRSVHDKLVEVEKTKESIKPKAENNLNKKDADFDKIFTEEITVDQEFEEVFSEDLRQRFDPKRKGKPINVSNFGKDKLSESYELSNSGAINLLLLGNCVDEHDFDKWIHEKKESKYLTDKNGKIRTFMLRRAAAKEAHTINGTVMPYKNGYVIKLNEENDNVSIYQKTFQQIRESSFGRSNQTYTRESGKLLTEGVAELTTGQEYSKGEGITGPSTQETTGTKITLAQIRKRQKEKVTESIDKGIEPGVSMSATGENPGRPTLKVKAVKKPFEEMIGDGGEMLQSMADKKEDELKKVGINLKSFKAKKFVG